MWHEQLIKMGACADALKYSRKYANNEAGFAEAWEECKEAGWMVWLGMRLLDVYGVANPEVYRLGVPSTRIYPALMAVE